MVPCKHQAYKVFVENKISKKMKMFWYNHGGGFTSRDFNAFCELYGITCQLTNSYSPQKKLNFKMQKTTLVESPRNMLS